MPVSAEADTSVTNTALESPPAMFGLYAIGAFLAVFIALNIFEFGRAD